MLRREYAGDPAVRAAAATLIERLAAGLADLVNVINPDRVLLGGLHRDLLEADPVGLRAAVADRSPWGRGAGVPLVPAALEQSALIGAAEIAWQPVLDDPASAAGTVQEGLDHFEWTRPFGQRVPPAEGPASRYPIISLGAGPLSMMNADVGPWPRRGPGNGDWCHDSSSWYQRVRAHRA